MSACCLHRAQTALSSKQTSAEINALDGRIFVLLNTENCDDLEIRVADGSRSLKVTPVNSSCASSY